MFRAITALAVAGTLLLATSGCVSPTTQVRVIRDPATGQLVAEFERGWMAGPVELSFDYEAPDGTRISGHWASEINLDAAQSAYALQQTNLGKALDLAAEAAKVAARSGAGAAIP